MRMIDNNGLLKIIAKLDDQVQKADAGLSWRERVLAALANPDDEKGQIKAVQILRDAGQIDEESAFFVIAANAGSIAFKRGSNDAELTRINQAIKAAEKAHGLDPDEYWPLGEAPDDVEELRDAYGRREDAILAAVLQEHREDGMADLFLNDRDAWRDQREKGRFKMLGPLPDTRHTEDIDQGRSRGLRGLDK